MKIHWNIRKYMKTNSVHEFAFIFHVLTAFEMSGFVFLYVFVFFWFSDHPTIRAPKKHEFRRYSDPQIFYQDPIGEQNDGWSEPPKMSIQLILISLLAVPRQYLDK